MTMYDCPRCGGASLVCWDGRARAFLCLSRQPHCGFSARAPGGQCACGHDRDHAAELISQGRAEVTKAWMESQR